MGCWTESCAMSGLPIMEDDHCFAVVVKEEESRSAMFEWVCGTADVLGWYGDGGRNGYCTEEDQAVWVFEGHYNDYGYLKEHKMPPDKVWVLVSEVAWDFCQENFEGLPAYRFFQALHKLRLQLNFQWGASGTGTQWPYGSEDGFREYLLRRNFYSLIKEQNDRLLEAALSEG